MTSSMLAGERRWASARRGGMTVLGKVAVPKPLNLPSQKLENHGLDPNVEIVPKGSLSWGSRPSSSTSNPWGSSALSPTADGTTGSPSHPSGRPSSGGGLSRPSTAGSERMHEPAASTWGPNSRPSSASGVLTSNQSSLTASRPHSADTRPGSSNLSRFAEPVADNSVAWGPNGTAEKLLMPSKNNDFSLSSGDFPTLGSEKDNPGKSSESHDHRPDVRPGSASGRAAPDKDRNVIFQADVKSGTVNTWTRDGPPHVGDGVRPEKWQGEPQQYVNPNVIPQHFDGWRGPPMNAPASVWYRGPPGCPPYPPAAHGGFPMEPFPYYRPQIPPALANSQPGPPPGAGPGGHHPKNGDFYRPQMPDAFMRPGMPMRPGFYPGPVPYDSYYGPPMGYKPNERDIPFMGMPPGPPVYNMYPPGPAQNPSEPNDANFRAGGHGSTGNSVVSEQLDSARAEESRGPYKVLRKRENAWDGDVEEKKWAPTTATNLFSLEKSDHPRPSFHKNEHGSDTRRNEDVPSRISKFVGNQGHSSDSVIVHSREGVLRSDAIDDSWGKKSEIEAISFSEGPQVLLAKPEDLSLIQKIEGLNAKVRASDVREDTPSGFLREEQRNRSLGKDATTEVGSIYSSGDLAPPSRDMSVLTGDDTFKSTIATAPHFSRRAQHGVQSRADNYNKGRLNNQDADGRRKKHPGLGPDSAAAISNQNIDHANASFQAPDHHISIEAAQKPAIRNAGESSTAIFDSTDGQAQRAKMRELAKQRAIQLQKEEEERIREQKAKALAKLEELNRRSLAADGTAEDVEKTVTNVPVDGSQNLTEPAIDASKHDTLSSDLDVKAQAVAQISKSSTSVVRQNTALSRDSLLGTPKNAQQEPVVSQGQVFIPKQDVTNATGDESKTATLVNDGSLPRQKRVGQRENQSFHADKSKSTLSGTGEKLRGHAGTVVQTNVAVSGDAVPSLDLSSPNNSNILPESTTHQRRKSNRSSKNKQKFDDASTPATDSESSVSNETNLAKVSTDNGKPKSPQFGLDPSAVLAATDSKNTVQPNSEQNSSLPSEEVHARAYNQYKPQQSRRMPRNPQANRPADRFHGSDAVMWAPVRSQNKAEPKDEASETTVMPTKSISSAQPNLKNKRAEMEIYIPKSAAKELAQQGSIQQPAALSSPGKSTLEDTVKKGDLGSVVESKSDDIKQNKPVKPHGASRQRGPTELHHGQGFQQGSSSTSNTYENHQKPIGQHESSNVASTETNNTHDWDPSDGWFMPEDPPTEVAHVTSVVKDQRGVTGKGKRPTFKGQRSTINNYEFNQENFSGEKVDKNFTQSKSLEINQTERPVSSKENHPSQWQPRSQAYRGAKSSGTRNAHGTPQIQPEDSVAEYKNTREAPHTGNQEGRRERMPASFKGRAHSPNLDLGNMEDEAPFQQHHVSFGFKKNGGQNIRSGRQQHNTIANRERQMQQSQYKYQPVGSNNDNNNNDYNNNNYNNNAAPTDISFGTAPRYKERGSVQSKRGGGNFNGRQSGAVRAEAGYE